MSSYFGSIWQGVVTTARGLRLTLQHFFTKPTTIEYPNPGQETYFSPYERGLHEFEPDACIVCYLCAKACPVDCIDIGEDKGAKSKAGKVLTKFEIDYSKCLFCELCVDPCPVDCIHMGVQHDLASFDRTEQVQIDFVQGEGLWRTAKTSAHPEAGVSPRGSDGPGIGVSSEGGGA